MYIYKKKKKKYTRHKLMRLLIFVFEQHFIPMMKLAQGYIFNSLTL